MLKEAPEALAFSKRVFWDAVRFWIARFRRSAQIGSFQVFGKGVQKRSFRWYVPCVPRYVPFCLRNRKGIPLGTSRCNAFSETPFPNALSVRKRSVTKGLCTGYLAHVPRYVPFYLQNSKGIPLGTSTWNALSETPFPNARSLTPYPSTGPRSLWVISAQGSYRMSWAPLTSEHPRSMT